jgi:hypothetical protein
MLVSMALVSLSLSQVLLESVSEDGQLPVGLEAAEGLLGFQQAGGGPTECHLGIAPPLMTVPAEEIKVIQSVLTVVDGKIVYAGAEYEALSPQLPAILPEWSPVSLYGAYWQDENN